MKNSFGFVSLILFLVSSTAYAQVTFSNLSGDKIIIGFKAKTPRTGKWNPVKATQSLNKYGKFTIDLTQSIQGYDTKMFTPKGFSIIRGGVSGAIGAFACVGALVSSSARKICKRTLRPSSSYKLKDGKTYTISYDKNSDSYSAQIGK